MRTNYILVDYENVQPAELEPLKAPHIRLFLFVGASQTKLPIELVLAMQDLGESGKVIWCSAVGPNAVDFHIALHCGEIIAKDSEAFLHIISHDKGFDPLMAYLKKRKFFAQRVSSLDQISFLKVMQVKSMPDRISVVIEHFRKGASKPRSLKTLASTVATIFHKALNEQEVQGIVEELRRKKVITLEGTKLVYKIDAG